VVIYYVWLIRVYVTNPYNPCINMNFKLHDK